LDVNRAEAKAIQVAHSTTTPPHPTKGSEVSKLEADIAAANDALKQLETDAMEVGAAHGCGCMGGCIVLGCMGVDALVWLHGRCGRMGLGAWACVDAWVWVHGRVWTHGL